MREKKHSNCIICGKELEGNQLKYCFKCGIEKESNDLVRKRKSLLKHAIFNLFIKQYCEFGNFIMRLNHLVSYINDFSIRFFDFKITYDFCIVCFKKISQIEIIKHGNTNVRRRKTINGIRLNEQGRKKYGVQNKANLEVKKIRDYREACIFVSCKPGIKKLEEVYNNLEDSVKKLIDLEKTKEMYKKIEKIMFQKNIYRGTNMKVALAIYLVNQITQEKICAIINIKEVSLRSIRDLVGIYKIEGKWKHMK